METLVKNQVRLKTEVLKELVGKASKVCSFIESFPLTGLMEVGIRNSKLYVKTTDNINILELEKKIEDTTTEFYFLIDAKFFSSIVSKLTTPFTELVLEDKKLVVNANGRYEWEVTLEEDGTPIKLPSYTFDTSVAKNSINPFELKSILTMNKSCKAEVREMPSIFNYYFDNERVLTTDFYRACNNPIKLFNVPVCLPPELVEFIPLIIDDTGVTVQESGSDVLFSSSLGTLYGKKATEEDLNNFPAENLVTSLNENYDYSCLVNRTTLINALDRMCLFTDGFDKNEVVLTFTSDSITLTTPKNQTHETLKYLEVSNYDSEYKISIDALFLKNQLSSLAKEDITIKFGNEAGIELVCDKVTQLSSALGDEE